MQSIQATRHTSNNTKNIEFDLAPEGVISLETALSVVDMTLAKKLPKQQRYLKIAQCMAENPERIISNANMHFEENERRILLSMILKLNGSIMQVALWEIIIIRRFMEKNYAVK